jgi:hypothetical protein
MAIFKATYTRSRGGAKASVGYIQQRPGKDKEAIIRTLFSRDGALVQDHETYCAMGESSSQS